VLTAGRHRDAELTAEAVDVTRQEDVTAARAAASALTDAVSALAAHYPESVDLHRLRTDCARVGEDLDLLCGAQDGTAPPPEPPTPARTIIADTPYAHDFWIDAEDEGLGRADYRTRP
jgi:hypothetical protein